MKIITRVANINKRKIANISKRKIGCICFINLIPYLILVIQEKHISLELGWISWQAGICFKYK